MKHLLIVEDDAENNRMLREYLESHGYVCTQAFSGSEARLLFSMNEYDLILLDLMLPGIPGEELVSLFCEKTPVIVLSAKSSLDSKVDLLSAGAEDYLCKPFDLPELLVRIQVQLRRRARNEQSAQEDDSIVYQYGEWRLQPDRQELTVSGCPVTLTRHEFLILELLIRNPGRVFSKQMIYEYAWGEEYLAEDKTLNVHISNIRAKLKESGTDSYIQTVWGLGFKLARPSSKPSHPTIPL